MPSEKPILFNGDMVRAILQGRKTQTRRIVKPQRSAPGRFPCEWYNPIVIRRGQQEPGPPVFGFWNEDDGWKCPYGATGDRLWVREAHRILNDDSGYRSIQFAADGAVHQILYTGVEPVSVAGPTTIDRWSPDHLPKRRPSIHMPRWASRITLEVTEVRVERLQEISEADAIKEGAEPILVPPDGGSAPYTEGFRSLWDSINSTNPTAHWNANPFIWVVEFRRTTEE